MQMRNLSYLDALLSDICIGTSAAPTFLPAHNFTNTDQSDKTWDFNLIDGGVAANNPVHYDHHRFKLNAYSHSLDFL